MTAIDQTYTKQVLRYPKCELGGLHSGEIMNLVCVDSQCSNRGLVCPMCQMEAHTTHCIMPVKVFLEKLRELFYQTDSQDLNSITDYLRSIEKSKKELLSRLRNTVEDIAEIFYKTQAKIEDNYNNLRKNVLAQVKHINYGQSSISTKLPKVLTLLEPQSSEDSMKLQQQFRKYSEIIQYQGETLKVCDKAKILVESYAQIPDKISSLLKTYSSAFCSEIQSLPLKFDEKQKKKILAFCNQNKHLQISFSQLNKIAKGQEIEQIGYVSIINEKKKNQKVGIQIISNDSASIMIGASELKQLKTMNFTGLFTSQVPCVYSPGEDPNKEQFSQGSEQEVINQFIFGKDDIIDVTLTKTKVNFEKRGTEIHKQFDLPVNNESISIFVGLYASDSVKILE